ASISARYSDWAGGKANADALVAGLTSGTSIAIATTARDGSVSLAGFTPASAVSYAAADNALAGARRRLARLGISQPPAEQIQAGLIGGDVATPEGSTVMVQGALGSVSPVAAR